MFKTKHECILKAISNIRKRLEKLAKGFCHQQSAKSINKTNRKNRHTPDKRHSLLEEVFVDFS